jgi:predicted transcriptional regulator
LLQLAAKGNKSNDVVSKMDLFDWLDFIRMGKEEGKTLKEIADSLGWSETNVKNYSVLINKVTIILNLCREFQEDRVTEKVPMVTFNFTERFFRDSGLYDLASDYQLKFFEKFKSDGFKWNKSKVQTETSKYRNCLD